MPNAAAETRATLFDPEELVRRRYRKRLKQSELAAAVGISPGNLSRIENGRHGASPEIWGRIADALGCTVEDLERKPAS
jgi:transcriptional regulator with XRE-family HTH domain